MKPFKAPIADLAMYFDGLNERAPSIFGATSFIQQAREIAKDHTFGTSV